MKIAVITPIFPAISETFILNHITGLIDQGHGVTIIALRKNMMSQKHEIIESYRLLNKTTFVKKTPSNKIVCRLYAAWLISVYTLRYPLRMYRILHYLLCVDRTDFYKRLFFAFSLLPLSRDIYHFHFGQIGRLGAILKKMGFPFSMVTSFHGHDVNQIPFQKENDYYADLFERGDHFVANTEFTKNQAVNLGCNSDKISVIPVGLHVRDFPFQPRSIDENETVQILTVGRLVEKKGYSYSIQAIAQLINEGFNIHYTIAGDGPLRDELKELAYDLGIENNVTFYGEATQGSIIQLYNKSHLFVLSSVTAENGDKEGQALVLQEAQACGLPVVSTFHNGIPEGVLDGQSGLLVPEKNVNALADAIKKLLENPSSWEKMGKTGNQFARKYDIDIITDRLIDIYRKIKKSPS